MLDRADVVHYPVMVPVPPTRRPSVVTLHDLQHRDLPGLVSRPKRAFRHRAYDRSAQRADHVVVISDWVRARAIELLGLDLERVHTIHLGVDHTRFSPDPTLAREPFLLYPARAWPHKNHARLLDAFRLVRHGRPELRLVLTGAGHERSPLPEGVERRGRVSEADLITLYRTAAALVFPSLDQGFGLPPVEAMAVAAPSRRRTGARCPRCAATRPCSSTRRTSRRSLTASIQRCSADELSPAGVRRATAFTWERAATAHDLVYVTVAATGHEDRRHPR